ncbi:MAG TPA: YetF domain-containing protein [Gemmatimonadales bacterium]|nr:YetF domain-containing protein [Gemmatimonadales bacterium]
MPQSVATWLQSDDALAAAIRTLAVYAFAVVAVRLGSKRFLSQASAFDVIVAIMLGSIMSRAISTPPLWPMLLSGAVLIAAHSLLAALAYRLDWLGPVVKGRPRLLLRDGRVDHDAMRQAKVSRQDLEQAVRLQVGETDLSRVRQARLERDGSISVVTAGREPVVLDVGVEAGVQTVRIRLE